jgi:phytanoyl-CoA hydroxylase
MGIPDGKVRSYVDDGWLVVPDLVTREELRELEDDVVRFARGDYPLTNPAPAEDGDDDEAAMRRVLAVHFPHWVSDVMRRFIEHPAIVDVLTAITGAHLPHWDGRVKCMQSMLFVKAPGLPGQAWHQDERFIPTRDRSLLGAWIAIDDATVDNGCVWVLPGSHRNGYLWPTRPHGEVGEFDGADESFGFDQTAAVPVEVERGSVVFFNGYLLHKSHRNRSDGYRRALVNHYCNAWSLLPWAPTKTVPGHEIPTMDNRTTLMVAGEDPYEWRGRSKTPDRVFLRPHGTAG